MNDFFTTLKASTQKAHKAIEATPISMAIMSPNLDSEKYAEYMIKTVIVQNAIETVVFPIVSNVIKDIEARKKVQLAKNDLAKLNTAKQGRDIQFIDSKYKDDLYFNLGMLYVSEGSTLGGQYILRHVKQTLGADLPTSFLEGYLTHTGAMWKNLLNQLEELQGKASDIQRNTIIEGAQYAFERVYEVFNAEI